jgi:hypothetical protein
LTAITTGVVWLPDEAGILLEPDVSVEEALVSASCKVYPEESLVLIVTVSLAIVWAPEADGTILSSTVTSVVKRLKTGLMTELTVVVAVLAETTAVAPKNTNKVTVAISAILKYLDIWTQPPTR